MAPAKFLRKKSGNLKLKNLDGKISHRDKFKGFFLPDEPGKCDFGQK